MSTKKIGVLQAASNVIRAIAFGQTRCLSCYCCKSKEEMETPDLCRKCKGQVPETTEEFVERLKSSVPLCKNQAMDKPGPHITFTSKTWRRG